MQLIRFHAGEQLFPNKDSLAIAKEVEARREDGGGGGYGAFGHNSAYWRNLGAAWAGLLTTPSDMATLYQVLAGGGLRAPSPLGEAKSAEGAETCDLTRG